MLELPRLHHSIASPGGFFSTPGCILIIHKFVNGQTGGADQLAYEIKRYRHDADPEIRPIARALPQLNTRLMWGGRKAGRCCQNRCDRTCILVVQATWDRVQVGASRLFTFDIARRKGSFDCGQRFCPNRACGITQIQFDEFRCNDGLDAKANKVKVMTRRPVTAKVLTG